jgi:4-alpha-glucanotransferase
LRNRYRLPGMRILQFAFGGEREDRFLPHRYDPNTVVYTGTHDNDTTMGWCDKLTSAEMRRFRRYAPGADAAWDMIRLAWASVADLAIVPLQDILSLDNSARMNVPGQPRGNWRWRFAPDALTDALLERLSDMTEAYERAPQ